ncbi:hypothetical protein F3J11_03590 [Burkholderia sp. Cy-647]|nr:hypothetical protein [Burkholderia sp. Tr-860]NIF61789.1 hypothetical protein [Burkholderia sp. Cy-647]NIF94942.1 hypothetical protein [Burkholderia sp. Ax-1720]
MERNRAVLRCKSGDLARIKHAWNQSLVGRLVVVGAQHSSTEWNVTLLGEPGVTLTKDRSRLTAAHRMLSYDAALEPIDLGHDGARNVAHACRCG